MANDHDGIIYGKMNTVEINFLNGILVLVTKNAIVPPAPTAIKQATSDINAERYNGVQKNEVE